MAMLTQAEKEKIRQGRCVYVMDELCCKMDCRGLILYFDSERLLQ